VEGLDVDVLEAFLAVPGFGARLIAFEAAIAAAGEDAHRRRLDRLLHNLTARGYVTARARGKDVFAWRPLEGTVAATRRPDVPPPAARVRAPRCRREHRRSGLDGACCDIQVAI